MTQRIRLAVTEGFEPYSATWSEHRNKLDLLKNIAVFHGSYLYLTQVLGPKCVQGRARQGFPVNVALRVGSKVEICERIAGGLRITPDRSAKLFFAELLSAGGNRLLPAVLRLCQFLGDEKFHHVLQRRSESAAANG
jgi:hypothetical protein